jgi:methoxymalonate biosynthesis acyl carrier protein
MIAIDKLELKEIVAGVLRLERSVLEEIEEKTDLRNYNLSSITAVELLVSLEDRFDIVISEDDLLLENLHTIQRIQELIAKYTSN